MRGGGIFTLQSLIPVAAQEDAHQQRIYSITPAWQDVMNDIVAKKKDETRRCWEVATKDKNFDCIRNLHVCETRPDGPFHGSKAWCSSMTKSPRLTSSFHYKRRRHFERTAVAGWIGFAHRALFGFTSNNTIPPTRKSAPTVGEIKWLTVVSKCIPRKLIGSPGVLKVMPE